MSRLKKIREEREMSKIKLANETGIPASTLTFLEQYDGEDKGRAMTPEHAIKIAKVFGVTPDYILGEQAIAFVSSFDDGLINLHEKIGINYLLLPFHKILKKELFILGEKKYNDNISSNSHSKYLRSMLLHEIVGLLIKENVLVTNLIDVAVYIYDEILPKSSKFPILSADKTSYDETLPDSESDLDKSLAMEREKCLLLLSNEKLETQDIAKVNQLLENLISEKG